MQIYLVGGAVRDELLGLPIVDKDFMVVGATAQVMKDKGFTQVGREFPVFLHPKTQQEYALARTERKSGVGYQGFEVHASPEVTLEEDLIRRDLTINAIAKDADGKLHDPYGGIQDLNNRLLRHISPAFSEDPLRVLRVARFAARFYPQGFTVADETMALMSQMSDSGELNHLSAERVFNELSRALMLPNPEVFFQVLRRCGALKVILPEVDALYGVPQTKKWHPEVDTGIHNELCLQAAAQLNLSLDERFAVLCHDLGKALTPESILPSHRGHEKAGLAPTRELCERLKVPKSCQQLALISCELHLNMHRIFELRAQTIVALFDKLDAWRKPERVSQFSNVCLCDTRGRTGFEQAEYPNKGYFEAAFAQCSDIDVQAIIASGVKGPEIKQAINTTRIQRVQQFKDSQ